LSRTPSWEISAKSGAGAIFGNACSCATGSRALGSPRVAKVLAKAIMHGGHVSEALAKAALVQALDPNRKLAIDCDGHHRRRNPRGLICFG
jgi:hypothetical protein